MDCNIGGNYKWRSNDIGMVSTLLRNPPHSARVRRSLPFPERGRQGPHDSNTPPRGVGR